MSSPPPPSTVRLTDQALVAVHLARAHAAGRPATVAHLLVGLMGEPEGRAGRRLRRSLGGEPSVRLAEHPGLHAPGLARLSTAFIALPITDVPAWTEDLLAATLRTGGAELADLLASAGLDSVSANPQDQEADDIEDPETFGRGALIGRGLDDLADQAMARARAFGPGSRNILAWLDATPEVAETYNALPEVPLEQVLNRAVQSKQRSIGLSDLGTALLSVALEHMNLPGRP